MVLYNIGIHLYTAAIKLASLWNGKARSWRTGRRDIFSRMKERIGADGSDRPLIWIHAASLGEFEQGRPVIEAIRTAHPRYRILLTFFSPSGYEIRRDYPGADYIFYLPADTPRNVRRFLDIARPSMAVFIKYEFWLNYLSELRRRGIRTFIVSAIFRRNSVFFRPYGGMFRRALGTFERLFVQNEESRALLAGIGIDRVTVAGDTRFDRVAAIAAAARRIELIERFCGGAPCFIAGSTWGPDEEILLPLVNAHRDWKFIIAPHEMEEQRIGRIEREAAGGAVRYTRLQPDSDPAPAQVLIIDTIGILSSAYRYARAAYIGGGFGAGIHNTLEAATFGLPIAFGPNYSRFKEACGLIACDAARSVASAAELETWFSALAGDRALLDKRSRAAADYVTAHRGATDTILRVLFGPKP